MIPRLVLAPRACTPERGRGYHFRRCTCKHTQLSLYGFAQHPSRPPSQFHRNVLIVSERLGIPIKMSQERGHLVQLLQAVCLRFVLPYLVRSWALFQLILGEVVFLEHPHPKSCRVATLRQTTVTNLPSLAPNVCTVCPTLVPLLFGISEKKSNVPTFAVVYSTRI